MALVFTEIMRGVAGHRHMVVGTIAFDSSYPSGGEDFAPSLLGLHDLDVLLAEDSGTEHVVLNAARTKLQIYTADGTEASGDQHLIVPRVIAFGV